MQLIKKNEIVPGLVWVEIKEANLFLCCGCPPDATKFLKKEGFLNNGELSNGPNAILISDLKTQKGRLKNFSEFPLMDMLYNQEMIKGTDGQRSKPLVIGLRETVDQQVSYTCRGNYGYLSEEEMMQAGVTARDADKYMQLKLWFAHNAIHHADELFSKIYIDNSDVEVLNGVTIKRKGIDQFTIKYKNESCLVDLNIGEHPAPLPYRLKDAHIELNKFSVMHSGEGNGWHYKYPCMGSLVVHEGKIYAVDTGPGFSDIINHLGLDIQDISGVFMTHNHDDHFAGLTDLLKSTRQIAFFASKLVRLTVQKKFAELLGVNESAFHHFFKVHDLTIDQWNDVDGLDVKPVFTPHPVETNAFIFRKRSGEGERIYTHLADTISFENFTSFLKQAKSGLFDVDQEVDRLKAYYLTPSDLKKVDVGGGIIHGVRKDFKDDVSERLVFSHTDRPGVKTKGQMKYKASFGHQEVFFSGGGADYIYPVFAEALTGNFPDIKRETIGEIYEHAKPISKERGEKIVLNKKKILVIICGNVCENNVRFSDKILFDRDHILGLGELFEHCPIDFVVNTSSVKAVEVDKSFFLSKVGNLKSWKEYLAKKEMIRVIESSKLFAHFSCSNVKLQLAEYAAVKVCTEVKVFESDALQHLWIVKQGTVYCRRNGQNKFVMKKGEFFGAKKLIDYGLDQVDFQAAAGAILVKIPENTFQDIPLIMWMVYENCTTMDHICKVKGESIKDAGKDS